MQWGTAKGGGGECIRRLLGGTIPESESLSAFQPKSIFDDTTWPCLSSLTHTRTEPFNSPGCER
jgi:hypothetical protein